MWADAKVLHLTYGDIILSCSGEIHPVQVAVTANIFAAYDGRCRAYQSLGSEDLRVSALSIKAE